MICGAVFLSVSFLILPLFRKTGFTAETGDGMIEGAEIE